MEKGGGQAIGSRRSLCLDGTATVCQKGNE